MEKIDRIISNDRFKSYLNQLNDLEENRIYCKHGIEHLLDVARLAYIENLEKDLRIDKEIIYATAMLHDLGRVLEYTNGISHDRASAMLAKEILPECGFNLEQTDYICKAICEHRNIEELKNEGLCGVIYRADKKSRICFCCDAIKTCKWSREKKNYSIKD